MNLACIHSIFHPLKLHLTTLLTNHIASFLFLDNSIQDFEAGDHLYVSSNFNQSHCFIHWRGGDCRIVNKDYYRYRIKISFLDKTQLVRSTNERLGWDPMKGSHESRSTHSLGFVLSCDVFWNIFLVKLFIFIWNTMDYFFIVKVVGAPSQQVKCYHCPMTSQ